MQKQKSITKKSAFLLKTYEILENTIYSQIISWHNDGIGFVINNIDKFTNEILPLYFKHSNFASFIRQLNMYGFSKKRSMQSENYYHHHKFVRNQRELIGEIQRKVQKKSNKNSLFPVRENPSEVRISSELSIQLQGKLQEIVKPLSQHQIKRDSHNKKQQTQQKYIRLKQLISVNQTILKLQNSALAQLIQDIYSLHIPEPSISEQKQLYPQFRAQDFSNSVVSYYQIHELFSKFLAQKINEYDKKKLNQQIEIEIGYDAGQRINNTYNITNKNNTSSQILQTQQSLKIKSGRQCSQIYEESKNPNKTSNINSI